MKYAVFIATLFFFIGSNTASAFTINYSALRRIFAPQLSTNTISTSSVSDFFIGKNIVETVLSGSSSGTETIKDVVYDYFSTGSVETSCSVFIQDSGNTPEYTAVNPSIATINSAGSTTYVSAGTAYFNARIGRRTRAIPCIFSRTNNATSYTFDSVAANSAIKNMKDEVDARVSGETPSSTTYNIYSSISTSTSAYVRNTSHIASDIDLTCIPVFSVAINSAQTMGVLVAPDIMIQAGHSHPSGVMHFVKNDNTTVARTITSGMSISGTDIWVAKLDSNVPSGINPCKIFSSTAFANSISTTSLAYAQPQVIFTNQSRILRVGKINYATNFSSYVNIIRDTVNYNDWYSQPCCGDSGSPAFAIVNGEAVVLGVWYTTFSVPNLSSYITQINAAAATLGSSNSLSTVDLSGFVSF